MIAEPRKTGLIGEMRAAQYLRRKGYTIVAANYKTKTGEIDIIAELDNLLCIIEVKTRREGGMFPPSDAVDYKKEENVKSAAAAFISAYNIVKLVRYDIIEIILTDDKYAVRHIENAF
ncbi:MAG: YraN family protein [Clostridia bacterium]|nr:YraN family protein [Clostridia bacterium]